MLKRRKIERRSITMLNAMIVEAANDNVIVAIEPIAKGDNVTYNSAGQ